MINYQQEKSDEIGIHPYYRQYFLKLPLTMFLQSISHYIYSISRCRSFQKVVKNLVLLASFFYEACIRNSRIFALVFRNDTNMNAVEYNTPQKSYYKGVKWVI